MYLSLDFICSYFGVLPEKISHGCKMGKKYNSVAYLLHDAKCIPNRSTIYIGYPSEIEYLEEIPEDTVFITTGIPKVPCNYVLFDGRYSIYELLNRINAMFARYDEWMCSLIQADLDGKTLADMLSLSEPIFENGLFIVDSSHGFIACSDTPIMMEVSPNWRFMIKNGYMSVSTILEMGRSGEIAMITSSSKAQLIPKMSLPNEYISKNIYYSDSLQWHLYIPQMLSPTRHYMLELTDILGDYLQHVLVAGYSHTRRIRNPYDNFILDVISGTRQNQSSIQDQLRYIGWDINDSYVITVIRVDNIIQSILDPLVMKLQTLMDGRIILYNDLLVGVYHIERDKKDELCSKLEDVMKNIGYSCGISNTYRGFHNSHTAFVQAEFALNMRDAASKSLVAQYNDHTMEHILSLSKDSIQLIQSCHPALLNMLEYDRAHNTEYYKTFKVFVRCESSYVNTAALLNIHRNTLMHRLDRVRELFGLDPQPYDFNYRLNLLISFKILEFTGKDAR